MTDQQPPQIIILCEDRAHHHFIKGYCKAAGIPARHIIMTYTCPPGQQSAEQWVRERFEQTLITFRSKHRQGRKICLIVMIDADRYTPEERKEQLQENLKRKSGEPIGIFVPARNIQSWMAWLDGELSDEQTDYKQRYQKNIPNSEYGRRLRRACGQDCQTELPGSLQDAIKLPSH
ncbi:MAG: hypothetical protein K9G38_01595 [Bacteroidales bacterium]|nr:hypothetical protein [Bacteroidales bacterium]